MANGIVIPAPRESGAGRNMLNFIISMKDLKTRKKIAEDEQSLKKRYYNILEGQQEVYDRAHSAKILEAKRQLDVARTTGIKMDVAEKEAEYNWLKDATEDERKAFYLRDASRNALLNERYQHQQLKDMFNMEMSKKDYALRQLASQADQERLRRDYLENQANDIRKNLPGSVGLYLADRYKEVFGVYGPQDPEAASKFHADYSRALEKELDRTFKRDMAKEKVTSDIGLESKTATEFWNIPLEEDKYEFFSYQDMLVAQANLEPKPPKTVSMHFPNMTKHLGVFRNLFPEDKAYDWKLVTEEGAKRLGRHDEWLRLASKRPLAGEDSSSPSPLKQPEISDDIESLVRDYDVMKKVDPNAADEMWRRRAKEIDWSDYYKSKGQE